MLHVTDITACLQQLVGSQAPAEVPVQFPGVPLDASRLESWCEFWLTTVDDLVHRSRSTDTLFVLVDIHCFSRSSDKRAAFAIADQFREALNHLTHPLHSSQSQNQVGMLRFREATLRDMTRMADSEPRLPVQHLIVSTTGVAEEVLSP
ncbi:MAG: hypothetical protein KDA80_09705 [Planctomycetaceae bacterium]|nr:hypothetical protein [Planctomycetaceae bacterium]